MKFRDTIITILISVSFIAILCAILFKSFQTNYEERTVWDQQADSYYSKYNIKLKGIVINKVGIDNRYSTYTIRILNCNVDKHDVREFNEDYYLVIYGDSAKMVDGTYCAQVNDSISIDYTTRSQICWNKHTRNESILNSFSPFYRNLRKQGLGW